MEIKTRKSFSENVRTRMEKTRVTQKKLVEKSLLSKTTISRICRNSNDKGNTYQATLPVVMAVCVGLRLNREEAKELFFSAFPEFDAWTTILERKWDIDQANELLYENGLPLLGNFPAE